MSEHVAVNRRHWNHQAGRWVDAGERSWAQSEPTWGSWGVPESDLEMLPENMSGMDAIELGCGTAYVSAWMTRKGATVTGIDISERQLETARRLASEHDLRMALILGDAEAVPFPDESFDFAISEYGAALWCDPYAWVPEAHRVLRPGGALILLTSSTLSFVCSPVDGSLPVTERLERDYFGLHRDDWSQAVDEPGGVEFNLPTSEWFKLFRTTGFDVVGFDEPRAPTPGPEVRFFATADWAHRFPSEQVWKLRKPRLR